MATGRGHVFKGDDLWRGRMIEMLSVHFRHRQAAIRDEFGVRGHPDGALQAAAEAFPGMTRITPTGSRSPTRAAPSPA
jgi:oxygen-independent coproporphyrinogen-3 oxidase